MTAAGERGAFFAVFCVDVFNDFITFFVLEIDIDVGRLVALDRNETLEQHVDQIGIHIGDAETVADHRIGSGAAPLTENADLLRETNDIVHGKKVARIIF